MGEDMRRYGEYLYNIGELINGIKILEQIRVKSGKDTVKGYKYICLKCKYKSEINEYNLKNGQRCGVCYGKQTLKGYNDIATTHPEFIKYFVNVEDTYKYRAGSNKKVLMKCPDCGNEKYMEVNKMVQYRFSCPACSDGISYPEKFITNVLKQLDIDFKTQYSPEWADTRRYDFYFIYKNKEFIIEVDGGQHNIKYSKKSYFESLERQKIIDKEKERLANIKNIALIRIDCRISELEYIKKSTLASQLSKLFDLANIDWLKCHEFACSSRVREVCNLWNKQVKDVGRISKTLGLHRDTVRKYLKQGNKLSWCDYKVGMFKNKGILKASKSLKKEVICLDTGHIFSSTTECANLSESILGIKLIRQGISNVCNNKNNTYRKLKFKYISDLTKKDIDTYKISDLLIHIDQTKNISI